MAIRRFSTAALALLLGLSCAAQAGVYRWKDAKGVTHYADAPPPSGTYNVRELHAPPAAVPAPAAARPASDPAPAAVDPVAESAPAAATPANPAADTNCTIARANLASLRSDSPVGVDADGDGKPDVVMADSERAGQATLAERNIATFCNASQPAP